MFCSKNYTKDEPDKFGRSALIWAATQNSNEALVMLATYTHDISSADRNGYNGNFYTYLLFYYLYKMF